MEAPYGPPGGLPEHVRIDRGKDFLSKTVASVLAGFAVGVGRLPVFGSGGQDREHEPAFLGVQVEVLRQRFDRHAAVAQLADGGQHVGG
jgi:hypothetical protein